jgi:thiol-disulfide isomerase/thioredoxin
LIRIHRTAERNEQEGKGGDAARQARKVYHTRSRRDKAGGVHKRVHEGAQILWTKCACMRSAGLRLALFLLVIVAALLVFGRHHGLGIAFRRIVLGQHVVAPGRLLVGQQLRAVTLSKMGGGPVVLAPRPGRVLYLNVFTTWCPGCVQETPALQQLRKATASLPVDVVGVDQQENASTVQAFAAQYGLTYPIFIDDSHETDIGFGVHFLPTTFVIDGQGAVRAHVPGALTLPQMKRLVREAMQPKTALRT